MKEGRDMIEIGRHSGPEAAGGGSHRAEQYVRQQQRGRLRELTGHDLVMSPREPHHVTHARHIPSPHMGHSGSQALQDYLIPEVLAVQKESGTAKFWCLNSREMI